MPKGYGYDKPPKSPLPKASAFKMKGFSYPGQSPLKGKKKKAEEAAAKTRQADARAKLEDFEKIEGESTNLLAGTNTQYGQMPMPPPIQKRTPVRNNGQTQTEEQLHDELSNLPESESRRAVTTPAPKPSKWQNFKSKVSDAAGSKIGETVGTAVAEGLVNLAIGSMKRKPKQTRERRNPTEGFSQIQIGRKRT